MSEADRGIDGPVVPRRVRPAPRAGADVDAMPPLACDADDQSWLRLPRGIAVAMLLAVPFWGLLAWWLLG